MPDPLATTTAARLSVLAAAFVFSTGGAAIKDTALSAFQVAGFRSGIAALALALLLPGARKGLGLDLLPAALAYAGTLVLFVAATKLTTAAAAIFLQSTAPIWVLVLSPMLLGERARRRDLPYVALAGAGLLLVFIGSRDAGATAPQPILGNALGLASGLCYGLLMMAIRRLSRGGAAADRSMPATLLGNVLALAFCLPFSLPVIGATTRDLAVVGYLGIFQVGLAYWFFARGLRTLPAFEVSLLLLLEPVLNPVWTWLVHGERPSALAAAGGALLCAALGARALLEQPTRARG